MGGIIMELTLANLMRLWGADLDTQVLEFYVADEEGHYYENDTPVCVCEIYHEYYLDTFQVKYISGDFEIWKKNARELEDLVVLKIRRPYDSWSERELAICVKSK